MAGNGDAVTIGGGTAAVTNCTLTGNVGAVSIWEGTANLTSCVIAANDQGIWRSADGGNAGALSTMTSTETRLANYLNVTNPTGASGNISVDPKLSSPYRNVHLQAGSPCINAGADAAVTSGSTDIDGQTRIQGTHVDIGSDESDGSTWTTPGRIWRVSPTGDDASDGQTWAGAKKTVAGALATAEGNDELWIAKGVYVENVAIPAGVKALGGFAGDETVKSARDWKANVTVLDGSGKATASVVKMPFQNTTLDGFAVRNGAIGIEVYYGSASATNCAITANGDGVSVAPATALSLRNSVVAGNAARGVFADGKTEVTNCTVCGNDAGICLVGDGRTAIKNTIVAFNDVGVTVYTASTAIATVSHTDVYGNRSSDYSSMPRSHRTQWQTSGASRFSPAEPAAISASHLALLASTPGDDDALPGGRLRSGPQRPQARRSYGHGERSSSTPVRSACRTPCGRCGSSGASSPLPRWKRRG